MMTARRILVAGALGALFVQPVDSRSQDWRDATYRTVLNNQSLEARFQAGLMVELRDRARGTTLLAVDAADMPRELLVFGTSGIDLSQCTVRQATVDGSLVTHWTAPDGTVCRLAWKMEPGAGDLVLRMTAVAADAVDVIRYTFPRCDIRDHDLLQVDGMGGGLVYRAPYTSRFNDPAVPTNWVSFRYVHPLIALFEGKGGGWIIEGRNPEIGPANAFNFGRGNTADILMHRGFAIPTKQPALFEIRIRTYRDHWADAVDPHLDWMQSAVGFVPIEEKPQPWIQDIRSQAYVPVGDFEAIEALARRLDPSKTYIGRMAGFRPHGFDSHFPDYQPSEDAVRWFRRVRELGFHVGVHINTAAMDFHHPENVKRFRRGFAEVIVGPDGEESYSGPGPSHYGRVEIETGDGLKRYWGVLPHIVYTSTANPDWRAHLIAQLKPLVDAGVDVIYLDEAMSPSGKFLVDGVTAIQGVMALERELLDTYPHVAIQTEQVNPMCGRWGSFVLAQHKMGHPIGGYVYHRFLKFVPESFMSQPTGEKHLDDFQRYGFLYPGASTDPSWLEIADAFHAYDLEPDVRLPLEPRQLFGYRGAAGVTAYYEKHDTRRGLVVYPPGGEPVWHGMRVYNVRTWDGPGALPDWALYDGARLIGLNPTRSYVFDPDIRLPPDRFHVTRVPADFLVYYVPNKRIWGQEIGENGEYYRIYCTGHGEMEMFVPDDVDVYLNDQPVHIDRATQTARAHLDAGEEDPDILIAFRRSEAELSGHWVNLPWSQAPQEPRDFLHNEGKDIYNHVGGRGQVVGRFPRSKSIRLQGSFGMSGRPANVGPAVVRINGREVVRVTPVDKQDPPQAQAFDVDISEYARKYVFLQFGVEEEPRGLSTAYWSEPRIEIARDPFAPAIAAPGPDTGWSSLPAVSVRASSTHHLCVPERAVDGSGIHAGGMTHETAAPEHFFISGTVEGSLGNPRGGTAEGGHWIEFAFDRVYPLSEMWIWNFASITGSYDWRVQGFKDVTVQYSVTGGSDPAEWSTAFEGTLPKSAAGELSKVIDFDGAKARYVVITTAADQGLNWSNGQVRDAGLSEVRFYLAR